MFQPPRPPKSAGIKPPLLDFACYATSYAQSPAATSYAVVHASFMGQGLTVWMLRRFLDVFRLFYKKSKDHFIKSMLDLLKLQVVLKTNPYLVDSLLRL